MEPLYISYARHAGKTMWIGIGVLALGVVVMALGVIAVANRNLTGVVAIVIGLAMALLGALAVRSYTAIKQGFLRIGPEGITSNNAAGRIDIGWNEIAWAEVSVAVTEVTGRTRADTKVRLASTYGFNGRADIERLRDTQLPAPYTHAIGVITDMKPQIPPVEAQQIAHALAAFGGQRFAGLHVR